MKTLDGVELKIEGTRPARPHKEKKVLEKDIQREICDWLSGEGFFFWRQNTIPVFDKGRFRALPKYTPRGLPDIICLFEGRLIGLEVKVPDYWKFTDDQKNIKAKINANGGAYHLVTSLEQAQEIMSYHRGAIRAKHAELDIESGL